MWPQLSRRPVAEQEGLDELRGLVERRARTVPPPRRPRSHLDDATDAPEQTGSRPEPQPPAVKYDPEPQGSAGPEPARTEPGVAQALTTTPPGGSERSMPSATSRERAAEPLAVLPQSVSPDSPAASATHVVPEATANLTLRIRQSLDLRLVELLHSLRRDGVRSSKKELIEMCLSELPFEPSEQLRARLRAYRETVPKEPL